MTLAGPLGLLVDVLAARSEGYSGRSDTVHVPKPLTGPLVTPRE